MLSSCWSLYCPSVQAFIQLYRNQDFCIWKYCPSVWGNDTYITTFKILLLVARIAYPQAPEKDAHYVLALFDLLKASGSQYLLTSLCYISQYFVLKAAVFLSLLHSSWSQGKRNFSHLHPPTLFPLIQSSERWFSNHIQDKMDKCGRGTLQHSPCSPLLGEQLPLSQVSYLLLSQWGGQGVRTVFVQIQPLGMLYSLGEPRGTESAAVQHDSWKDGGNVREIGGAGEKTMSDPSRYLNNVSWLKWNALVRPSGGEFDIFCATCKIKRKCCWLLHCLVKGTGADRNVIKLPAAFICCHSSPCNEYNNNFIYSLAYCSFAYAS